MIKGLFLALLCGILFLILHILIFRNINVRRRFRTLVGIWAGLLFGYGLLFALLPEEIFSPLTKSPRIMEGINFLYGIFIYALFLYLYFYFVSFFDRSITTRIMVEIENAPEKRLSLNDIKRIYDLDKKLHDEIEDMVYIRYIFRDKEYIRNAPKGRRHAVLMRFLRQYLGLGSVS